MPAVRFRAWRDYRGDEFEALVHGGDTEAWGHRHATQGPDNSPGLLDPQPSRPQRPVGALRRGVTQKRLYGEAGVRLDIVHTFDAPSPVRVTQAANAKVVWGDCSSLTESRGRADSACA